MISTTNAIPPKTWQPPNVTLETTLVFDQVYVVLFYLF